MRRRIVAGAYALFYAEGFQRVSLDAIASRAGLTKRTLYNHFETNDALVAAALAEHARLAADLTQVWCEGAARSPEGLVRHLFTELRDWASTPEWRGSGFTRAAMELAWAPGHPARAAASAHKTVVERAIARALERRGARDPARCAAALAVLIEGANTLRMIHGDDAWYDVAEAAALDLL